MKIIYLIIESFCQAILASKLVRRGRWQNALTIMEK
jgi:hypothetical protein